MDRYSWQKMYIEIAKVVAKRSEDPRTKVGAVLVKDGCIIGVGYNGVPRHCNYTFDWNSDEKYKYVIHAEMNAIANANMQGISCKDADIYITLSPCSECMKLLVQHQIRNVFYLEQYREFTTTKFIADNTPTINLIQLNENNI